MNRPGNGSLAPRRWWLRDRQAEGELLALLEAGSDELPATGAPRVAAHVGAPGGPADQASAGRSVSSMELMNR